MGVLLKLRLFVVVAGALLVVVNGFAGQRKISTDAHPSKSSRSNSQSPLSPLWYGVNNGGHFSDDLSKSKSDDIYNEKQESNSSGRFATGDELRTLRHELKTLREELRWAENGHDIVRVTNLRQAVEKAEEKDPDLVYVKALGFVEEAKKIVGIKQEDREAILKRWTDEAAAARAHLKRFSLEGLWVGSYGEQGYELINVTYTGDSLIATKVTGDKSVPRGSVAFKADLSPGRGSHALGPIMLSKESATKWGTDKLERYPGQGYIGKKSVDGNFILFEDNFSFVWLPTKQHVLFGRPSAEATIRLLRDIISEEDAVENMRDHLERCFEMDMTTCIARQQANEGNEPLRRIARQKDLFQIQDCTLEPKDNHPHFNFWDGVYFLKTYLEDFLRDL